MSLASRINAKENQRETEFESAHDFREHSICRSFSGAPSIETHLKAHRFFSIPYPLSIATRNCFKKRIFQ